MAQIINLRKQGHEFNLKIVFFQNIAWTKGEKSVSRDEVTRKNY